MSVTMGRANVILDNLIAAGKAKPMIVVMPNGNATQTVSQGYAYGPTPARQSVTAPAPPPLQASAAGGRGGAAAARPPQPYAGSYPESLVKDVIPFVEKHYRVLANKDNRAIAGLSMGGYISIPFALAHPDRIERLVLAHTRARADFDAEKAARNGMIEALRKDGVSVLPDRMLPSLLAANASSGVRQVVRDSIGRTSAEACIQAVTAMRDCLDQTCPMRGSRRPDLTWQRHRAPPDKTWRCSRSG